MEVLYCEASLLLDQCCDCYCSDPEQLLATCDKLASLLRNHPVLRLHVVRRLKAHREGRLGRELTKEKVACIAHAVMCGYTLDPPGVCNALLKGLECRKGLGEEGGRALDRDLLPWDSALVLLHMARVAGKDSDGWSEHASVAAEAVSALARQCQRTPWGSHTARKRARGGSGAHLCTANSRIRSCVGPHRDVLIEVCKQLVCGVKSSSSANASASARGEEASTQVSHGGGLLASSPPQPGIDALSGVLTLLKGGDSEPSRPVPSTSTPRAIPVIECVEACLLEAGLEAGLKPRQNGNGAETAALHMPGGFSMLRHALDGPLCCQPVQGANLCASVIAKGGAGLAEILLLVRHLECMPKEELVLELCAQVTASPGVWCGKGGWLATAQAACSGFVGLGAPQTSMESAVDALLNDAASREVEEGWDGCMAQLLKAGVGMGSAIADYALSALSRSLLRGTLTPSALVTVLRAMPGCNGPHEGEAMAAAMASLTDSVAAAARSSAPLCFLASAYEAEGLMKPEVLALCGAAAGLRLAMALSQGEGDGDGKQVAGLWLREQLQRRDPAVLEQLLRMVPHENRKMLRWFLDSAESAGLAKVAQCCKEAIQCELLPLPAGSTAVAANYTDYTELLLSCDALQVKAAVAQGMVTSAGRDQLERSLYQLHGAAVGPGVSQQQVPRHKLVLLLGRLIQHGSQSSEQVKRSLLLAPSYLTQQPTAPVTTLPLELALANLAGEGCRAGAGIPDVWAASKALAESLSLRLMVAAADEADLAARLASLLDVIGKFTQWLPWEPFSDQLKRIMMASTDGKEPPHAATEDSAVDEGTALVPGGALAAQSRASQVKICAKVLALWGEEVPMHEVWGGVEKAEQEGQGVQQSQLLLLGEKDADLGTPLWLKALRWMLEDTCEPCAIGERASNSRTCEGAKRGRCVRAGPDCTGIAAAVGYWISRSCHTMEEQQRLEWNAWYQMHFSSLDCGLNSALVVPPSLPGPLAAAWAAPTIRACCLPSIALPSFSRWLRMSQSQPTSAGAGGLQQPYWDRMVFKVYLPVEFGGDSRLMRSSWLRSLALDSATDETRLSHFRESLRWLSPSNSQAHTALFNKQGLKVESHEEALWGLREASLALDEGACADAISAVLAALPGGVFAALRCPAGFGEAHAKGWLESSVIAAVSLLRSLLGDARCSQGLRRLLLLEAGNLYETLPLSGGGASLLRRCIVRQQPSSQLREGLVQYFKVAGMWRALDLFSMGRHKEEQHALRKEVSSTPPVVARPRPHSLTMEPARDLKNDLGLEAEGGVGSEAAAAAPGEKDRCPKKRRISMSR
ncbi:unnamed protein product [Chrysoparadoxa australica]